MLSVLPLSLRAVPLLLATCPSSPPPPPGLLGCPSLVELDLGHNLLADPACVLPVLAGMPRLRTLTLLFNPLSNIADPGNKEPPVLRDYR